MGIDHGDSAWPAGYYIERLETDDSGRPSGVLVSNYAEASMFIGSPTDFSWNTWPFDPPITLIAGETYWIVCRTDATQPSCGVNFSLDLNNSYSGRRAMYSKNGGAWENYLYEVDLISRS